MAPFPSSGGIQRRCMICRTDVIDSTAADAARAESCAHCGNPLALAKDHRAAISFSAFPILDQQSMDVFERISSMIAKDGPSRVDFDFKGVSFLSSAALGKLLSLVRVAKDDGVRITLRNLDHNIREVVEITGLKRLLAPDEA